MLCVSDSNTTHFDVSSAKHLNNEYNLVTVMSGCAKLTDFFKNMVNISAPVCIMQAPVTILNVTWIQQKWHKSTNWIMKSHCFQPMHL